MGERKEKRKKDLSNRTLNFLNLDYIKFIFILQRARNKIKKLAYSPVLKSSLQTIHLSFTLEFGNS